MFGREFHIEDVLVLWDGIFASLPKGGSNLVSEIEYVSTAMLLYVREALLIGDYMACLRVSECAIFCLYDPNTKPLLIT